MSIIIVGVGICGSFVSGADSSSPKETSSSDCFRLVVEIVGVNVEVLDTSVMVTVSVVAPRAAGETGAMELAIALVS